MKYDQIVTLLKEGKKLKVEGLNYVYGYIPEIKVVGENGESDCIKLECISDLSYDIYLVEKNIPLLESITLEKYIKGNSIPISYIFSHPYSNQLLKAHLINGEEVDYTLSVFDLEHITGEYIPDETQVIHVKLWFFKTGCQDLFSESLTTYTYDTKEPVTPEDIANYIRDTEWKFSEASIVVQFSNVDWKPLIIDANTRRHKFRGHQ